MGKRITEGYKGREVKKMFKPTEKLSKSEADKIYSSVEKYLIIFSELQKSPLSFTELKQKTGLADEPLRRQLKKLKDEEKITQESKRGKYFALKNTDETSFILEKIHNKNKKSINKQNFKQMTYYRYGEDKKLLDFCLYDINKKELSKKDNNKIFNLLIRMSFIKKEIDKILKKNNRKSFICSIDDLETIDYFL